MTSEEPNMKEKCNTRLYVERERERERERQREIDIEIERDGCAQTREGAAGCDEVKCRTVQPAYQLPGSSTSHSGT